MDRKYVLTNETIKIGSHVLYRIKALINFDDVKSGDLGGFVESDLNLSQEGNCWIYDKACVYEYAKVYENAKIYDYSHIHWNAKIYENAKIYNNAKVFGNAKVYGHSKVYKKAIIKDYTKVYGHAEVYGETITYDYTKIHENAKVHGEATIHDYTKIYGNAEIFERASIDNNSEICGDAKVYQFQNISYGILKSDILKEKKWNLAIKCIDENIKINNNKLILYDKIKKTRNKNIFLYMNKILLSKKTKYIDFYKFKFDLSYNSYIESSHFIKCEIDLNNILDIHYKQITCNKIKILEIYEYDSIKLCKSRD